MIDDQIKAYILNDINSLYIYLIIIKKKIS